MFTSRRGSPALARSATTLIVLCFFLAACSPSGGLGGGSTTPTAAPTHPTSQAPSATPNGASADTCPQELAQFSHCQTPHSIRVAYGVESLIEHGFTGKGQTVVDIVSFGSPTLQQDMDVFDQEYGLPPITIQVISPLDATVKKYDPRHDEQGWAGETELDVQIIHALAPDAGIVVLTSPVAETEGTIGLPEFRQLVQYTIDHHLGSIVSQSWGASEVTLKDAAGQAEIQKWDALFKQASTQQGITFFSSSGDNGATDYEDLQGRQLSPTATTSFATDDPWVTSVGGTSIRRTGTTVSETAWPDSGGGFSTFFPMPDYQKTLPASVQSQFKNRRGVPDVSAAADPETGLAFYFQGGWNLTGGTSASAPLWAGLMAIANQMAGHPLGFINPALYKLGNSSTYAQDFHDVVAGNNNYGQVQGYPAIKGWDPVTGLGSPN